MSGRTRFIYGTAAAVIFGVIGLAIYESEQDGGAPASSFDTTPPEEYIEQDRLARAAEMYREVVPNATDDQIAGWEADIATYNEQVEAWDACLEAHGGYDEGCTEPDESLVEDHPLGYTAG